MTTLDRDAVRDVLLGNRDAFAHLIETHQRRLFGLVLMVVRAPDVAEEIVQDAFVRAFTHLRDYDNARPFYPWLATIAVRLAQNWLRRPGRRRGVSLEDVAEPATAAAALATLITDQQQRLVWEAVARLSPGERTAALLYYRDGLPVREVAMVLGVAPGTIKTLLFRARARLRARLEPPSTFGEDH